MSCPFGFSATSDASPSSDTAESDKFTAVKCVLCRSVLYQPVRTQPCQHVFCRGCIAPAASCVVCGVDITGVCDDATMECKVQEYVTQAVSQHAPAEPAFWLQLAARVAGCNSAAAQEYVVKAEAAWTRLAPYPDDTSLRLAVLLGQVAVVGGGDGTTGAGVPLLRRSEQVARTALQRLAAGSRSASDGSGEDNKDAELVTAFRRVLATTLSRLGDEQPGLEGKPMQVEAMQLRSTLYQQAPGPETGVELATSMAKVAGYARVMGYHEIASGQARGALELLESLGVTDQPENKALYQRVQQVRALLTQTDAGS